LREHLAWLVFIENEPGLDFLHSDKRYRTIVNTMGLPPAYQRSNCDVVLALAGFLQAWQLVPLQVYKGSKPLRMMS